MSSSRDAELSALRAELEGRVSDRESEIARVQSELAESKLSLESERDALQAQLVELSSAQDEELTTTLAAQLSDRDAEIARVQSELAETKSQLESERDALRAELSSVSSSRDAELSALRAELESRVSDRESEIARVQSELAETKLSLESERDALQARLVELSSAQDEELATTLAAQLSDREPRSLACNLSLLRRSRSLSLSATRFEPSFRLCRRRATLSCPRCALSLRVAFLIASLRSLACSPSLLRRSRLLSPSATRSRLVWLSCRLLKMRSWRRRSRRSFLIGTPRSLACNLSLLRRSPRLSLSATRSSRAFVCVVVARR